MKRYGLVAALALALTAGCGDDGAAPATPGTTAMFMGRYTARTSIAEITRLNADLAALKEHAEEQRFAMIEPAVMPGAAVTQWLSRLDADFSGDASGAGAATLQGQLRAALARWHAAPNDMSIAKGVSETAEKTFIVAQLLAMHSEIRAALAEIDDGEWAEAREHWDRAAAWFTALEPAYGRRSDTTVADVWGPGSSNVTDENLSARSVELLSRGAQLIDAHAAANASDAARQLLVYSTKYAYLSALNYANVFETRARTMGDLEYPRAEGGTLFEGVLMPFHNRASEGSAQAAAVSAARARWTYGVTAAQGPTRLSLVRDCGALYGLLTAEGVAGYATASDPARAATRSTLRGVVDTLDEALAYARQDPAALRTKLTTAEARSMAGDHAGAAALLREVQQAVDAVAHVGQ